MVAKAWVGTNAHQSAMLIPLIREVIQSGRTVAIAVEESGGEPIFDVEGDLDDFDL